MKRIKTRSELCNGCDDCVTACKKTHGEACCSVFSQQDNKYYLLFCRNCPDAACLRTCISGAISRDKDTGTLMYDVRKCASCYMCVMTCPYGIPVPNKDDGVVKCDLCRDIADTPLCIKACKRGALSLEEIGINE